MDESRRSVTALKGVGPQLAEKLAKLDLHTLTDLIFHLPSGYQDRTRLTPIRDLRDEQFVQVQGVIIDSKGFASRRFSRLQVTLEEAGHLLRLTFFNFSWRMKSAFAKGVWLRCYGKAQMKANNQFEMVHPECSFISPSNPPPLDAALTPVYPLTKGISQKQLGALIRQALDATKTQNISPLLPDADLDIASALQIIHTPPPDLDVTDLLNRVHPAQFRLALEELTAYRLALLREKSKHAQFNAPPLPRSPALWQRFIAALPFALTNGQTKSLEEISADLAKSYPMTRLVQGDVGCGKTLVAALAALQAIANGYQVALMAPTEILAEQHLAQFDQWFAALDIRVVPLLGKMSAKAKQINNEEIAAGTAQMIIGTHALFQEGVKFAKLGLCIIDEQHRFGVEQRLLLHKKGAAIHPHQLLMTATPIPRTLAQTLFANIDVSSIKELPPGRIPCETLALPSKRRPKLIERIAEKVTQGYQVYWVCPLIEESEVLNAEAAEKTAEMLRAVLPADIKVGLVHGRCKPEVKRKIMQDFHQNNIQLLVATTVIEVGINVPNANFMVIENAERLGLSQLHQLRGRVGRGGEKSYCILCYQEPVSEHAKKRLQLMQTSNSGFDIAEADMRLRGIGEILGTRQSGLMEFKIADPFLHSSLSDRVCRLSEKMLELPVSQQDALIDRWLGSKRQYAVV